MLQESGTWKLVGVLANQPMPCRLCTVVPTITARTSAMSTPVRISIRLNGSLRCILKVTPPTIKVAPRPIPAPSAVVAVPALACLAGDEAQPVPALDRFAAAVEARDPLAPVDAMKEPVGDQQQHPDRDHAG